MELRSVVLVDGESFPRKQASYGWLNTRTVPMLQGLGPKVERHLKKGFKDVSFHDADFSKTAKPNFEGTAGYLIDRVAFTNDLVGAAVKSGAKARFGAMVSDIKLLENSVRLILEGGETVESRLLVLASGRDGVLLDRAGFTPGTMRATLSGTVSGHVLELDGGGSISLAGRMPPEGKRVIVSGPLRKAGGVAVLKVESVEPHDESVVQSRDESADQATPREE